MIPPLPDLLSYLDSLLEFKPEWDALPRSDPGTGAEFYIRNGWFEAVDAEIAYATLRKTQPLTIIEVGAGMSTRLIAKAIQVNGVGWLLSIDPDPGSRPGSHDVLRRPVQDVDLRVFEALHGGDVLFIDSSHIYAPGNDVDVLYNRVLPSLPTGVLVHCHDIFLPNNYPSWWAHRGYDEQTHLASLLTSGGWRVLWSSQAVHLAAPDRLRAVFQSYQQGDYPASLWMVKE